jgi:ribonuclease T1
MTTNHLPGEAIKTIELIKKGGPFRYHRDGVVFRNRENKLPGQKDPDYYHEYTVETPGRSDRGARRIITGKNGEIYYTDDRYQTFKKVT